MALNNSKITGIITGALGIGAIVFSTNLAKMLSGTIYDSRCANIDSSILGQIGIALAGIDCHIADLEKVVILIGAVLLFFAFIKIMEKD